MNIQLKYVLIFLIFYVVIKIIISKEHFQTQTTSVSGSVTTSSLIPDLRSYDSENIMNINNNSLTYLENDVFNLGNKISATKDKCPTVTGNINPTETTTNTHEWCENVNNSNIQNNSDRINAKRLCIIEGNDIECINSAELGNALNLPEYRKNSVCIDGTCLSKGSIDILKSMTPSGRSDPNLNVQLKNRLKLKSADNTDKCFSRGQTRAHTCASHNSRLTVTRADGGNPNSGWGWGQNLKVGGNTKRQDGSTYITGVACGSRFAADAYVWDGNNNASSCLPFEKHIGNRSSQAVEDLPLGKYYTFRPGFHRGTDQLDQYCCWGDQFKFTLSAGQKIGGSDLYYETMAQDKCSDDKSDLRFEASKDANRVLIANGSIDGPAGQTEVNPAPPADHH